jgi:hypothetical protein
MIGLLTFIGASWFLTWAWLHDFTEPRKAKITRLCDRARKRSNSGARRTYVGD